MMAAAWLITQSIGPIGKVESWLGKRQDDNVRRCRALRCNKGHMHSPA